MNEAKQPSLFDIGESSATSGKYVARLPHPAWTEHKALLIRRYTKLFVMITHHGTYIDAFAGPQYPDKEGMWSAKLVLEGEPKFLRHFHLFETNKTKFSHIEKLLAAQPEVKGRTIAAHRKDSNVAIKQLLARQEISEKEATFCLLDQHTIECEWSTVEALASYPPKKSGRKIELFYFLANHWFHRCILNTQDEERVSRWWGRDDWRPLLAMRPEERAACMARRFEKELGYKYATVYPIYDRDDSAQVMYFMIHATDHDVAPGLMTRAYRSVHGREPTWDEDQTSLFGGAWMLHAHEGRLFATCSRCLDSSAHAAGSIERAGAHLLEAGWKIIGERWLCPTCEGKPLGPPRRARKKERP